MALRRRLSPGLPLSHTSEKACDPAVLFMRTLAIARISEPFLYLHMADDYSNELSQCTELLLPIVHLYSSDVGMPICQDHATQAQFNLALAVLSELLRRAEEL